MDTKKMNKWEVLAIKVLSLLLITASFVPIRDASSWKEFFIFMALTAILSYLVIWLWDMLKALLLMWKRNAEN